MKVIVKIIQKINNKIFGINASLGPFLKRPLLRVSARVSIGLSEIVRMNKTDFIINAYKKCQLSFEIFEHFETEFLH